MSVLCVLLMAVTAQQAGSAPPAPNATGQPAAGGISAPISQHSGPGLIHDHRPRHDRHGHDGHHHHHHHGDHHGDHRHFRFSLSLGWPGLSYPYWHHEHYTSWEFFGPPMVSYYPVFPTYVEYVPVPVHAWLPPVWEGPGGPPLIEQPMVPIAPRNATTDVPEQVLDQLLPARRPTLAQRAQAARLEGGGDRLFRAGHFDRASDRYKQTLSHTPDNDEVSFKLAAALIAGRRYDQAARVLRDALRERPDWPHVEHDLRALFPVDAVDRAIEDLGEEAARPNSDPDLPFLRAYLMYFGGRQAEAEAILRDPPPGDLPEHYRVFIQAMDRARAR